MTHTRNLTSGNVKKIIFTFFMPLLFTNLMQQIYSFADTAIVGKGLGDASLAAVGNMSSLTFLIIGFSMGMTNGFSILIAQSYGAGDAKQLRKAIAASVKLSAVIALFLTAVSISFLHTIMKVMQTPESILHESLTYGYIIFGGLAATIAYNMCAAILRALGDSRTPFIAIIVSTIVNIVLDCVCIFVLGTGVEGAAAATITAQVISASICFSRLRKIEMIHLSREDFAYDGRMYMQLLKNGLPMACMNSITAVGCIVVQYFVNGLGVAYTSAYSACSKYINMFMLPGVTAGYTISSFTSQNYGAGEYQRIREGVKVCAEIAFGSYLILGSVMFFFPSVLAGIILSGDDSIALASEFLPICGVMLFAVDLLFVFRQCVQGMGYPFVPMCSGILEMFLRISVIIIFIPVLGFRVTALAEVSAWSGALLTNFIAYQVNIRRSVSGKAADTEKKVCSACR